MDILLTIASVTIAVLLYKNKHITINVNHTYEHKQPIVTTPTDKDYAKFQEDQKETMDNVIADLNRMMGVRTDDNE